MRRVVVTGMGAITPLGKNVKIHWDALIAGKSGASVITRFDTTPFKTKFACEVQNFDPLDYFDRKESRKTDLFAQFGLIAAEEAIHQSEIDFNKFDRSRTGVIWASGIGGFETFENEMENYFNHPNQPRFSPFFITKLIANSVSGLISIKHGLHGVNYCPVTACASSAQAIIQAFNYIRLEKADVIIAGGAEAPITKAGLGGFNAMKALSTNNENFMTASRPFDQSRDGFVMGEGAGALIIESYETAIQRGAPILAEIVGGGEASDAYHITNTHPEGKGAELAIKMALEEAHVTADQIQYVNAHATSTGPGDISEINGISAVFGGNVSRLLISAQKSMTGHLLGAAGAIETISTIQSLNTGIIPPTINTIHIDEILSNEVNLCLQNNVKASIDFAINSNFGFGGHSAAILLKKTE